MPATTTYSGTRTDLRPVMDRVTKKREEAIITRRDGDPVVMLSLDEWSSINETLHIMSSEENIDALRDTIKRLKDRNGIRQSRRRIDRARRKPAAEVARRAKSR